MSAAPRRPGLRPGRAAGIDTAGLEHSLNIGFPPKSQYPAHLRQQRAVERVCKIPRLVAELLAEISRVHGIEDDIAARLERFAAVDHDLLTALGANQFPASPLRQICQRP